LKFFIRSTADWGLLRMSASPDW